MAVTQNTYTGNGATVLYSFTFPYLETTDVKVTINGTPTTAYTFANATTIQFNTAPANGAAIRIYRDTDDASLAATFYSGSAIRAQDLNDNFTQNLYVTQEVNNNSVNIDGSNPMVGPLNMNGFQITNLPVPAVDTNAATKKYVDDRFGNLDIPGHTRWRKVATASQTTFSGTGDYGGVLAYSPTREQVYINGALQQRGVDYAADNGTSVVFTVGLTVGDVVDIICVNNLTNSAVSNAANITYSGQFTGQTARTVAAKLTDVVSVKDFGAVGDGVTDDTAAIKAALNWANTQLPRKSVYIPRGTYRITSEINQCHPYVDPTGIPIGTKAFGVVYGDGSNATELRFEGTQYAWIVGSKTAFAGLSGGVKGVYGYGLRDLRISGADSVCEHGLWIGGSHFGDITNVVITGFKGKSIAIYSNYVGGGTGSLWNKLSNINISGAGASNTDCYGIHLSTNANANNFTSVFVSGCRFGYYNAGGRNRFYGISGESQSPAEYMFGFAGQTMVSGAEFEVTSGTGTVPTAWKILGPDCRSSIYDAKVIGYTTHYENASGLSFPEVSFIGSTYESTAVGVGIVHQNVRLKPIVDQILTTSRLRRGTGTVSLAVTPTWTNIGAGLSDPNGRYSGADGYYSAIPQRAVFTRTDTSAYMDIQVAFKPFPSGSDFITLTSFAPGESSKTINYQDFINALVSKGYYDSVIVPYFRGRTTHTSPQNVTIDVAYLVSA